MYCSRIISLALLAALTTAAAVPSSNDDAPKTHLEHRSSQQVAQQAVQNAITAVQMQIEQDRANAAADAAARPGNNLYVVLSYSAVAKVDARLRLPKD
ncbi:hypothetical protein BDV26DRAFT_287881 [Aspergillus bertholletiae]|uniref:Uncharacterized protein n=1 Tax=Aspergillus bertholletiae TaxID=1226010 RepID=A0A5N7BMN5_9EURO|nr:hypothetical protein BDV26DRAFT_287881 [Aspergillus bertholletiae]